MTSVVENINHYQRSIEKSTENTERLLYCVNKLYNLPVTVQHLQETGIGRTVNSLRKYDGQVGVAAKALVTKWKLMVAAEESTDNDEKPDDDDGGTEDEHTSPDIKAVAQTNPKSVEDPNRSHRNDHHQHRSQQNIKSEMDKDRKHKEHSRHDRHQHQHHKDKRDKSQSSGGESSSEPRRRHGDISAHHHSTSSKISSHSQSSSERDIVKSEKSHHNKSDKSKSSTKSSSSSKRDKSGAENVVTSSNDKHAIETDVKMERSEKKQDDHKSSRSHRNGGETNSSSSKSSKSKTNNESSHHKSSSHHHSSEKSESSSGRHKSKHKDKLKDDDGRDESTKVKHKSTSSSNEKSNDKIDGKSSSRSSKDKSLSSKSRRAGDEEESSRKTKSSSSKSVSEKPSPAKKRKHETDDEENGDNDDDDDGIDHSMGASFGDALGMLEKPAVIKSITKKKSNITSPVASTSSSASSSILQLKKPSSSYKPNGFSSATITSTPSLLASTVKLKPLEPELSLDLPTISNNYKPMPLNPLVMDCVFQNKSQPPTKKFHMTEEEAFGASISSKTMRTKVFSGNKGTGPVIIATLHEMCLRMLQKHIDALEYTGGVPFEILKPVLERATPEQLFNFEHYNPYLMEDSDILWKQHCHLKFRGKKRQEMETWREMYIRCLEEQEARLSSLTENIKLSQVASVPVKQTKMAFIDSTVKAPRGVLRKQAQFGTERKLIATPAARVASLANATVNIAKVGDSRLRVAANARDNAQVGAISKPRKAPLMAKAMQLMKGRFKR